MSDDQENAQNDSNSNEGCTLHVSNLTRNVNTAHLKEIFGQFGRIKSVDLQKDPRLNLSKGFAYIEYETEEEANRGQQFMDGGQIDGNVVRVTYVLVSHKRARHGSPDAGKSRRSVSPVGAGRRDGIRAGDDRGRGGVSRVDGDWREGPRRPRSPAGRRGPPERRPRSPEGRGNFGGRGGPGRRRGESPVRRRSPYRDGRHSRSPIRRRPDSPNRARDGPSRNYDQGPRRRRSASRSRSAGRRRSPVPYRRRRSRSPSSSPSPRGRRRRSYSSSSGSSRSSRSTSSRSSRSSSRSSHSRSSSRSAAPDDKK